MKKLSLLLAVLLILTACSTSNKQEVTLENTDGGHKSTVTYYAEGDDVYKQVTENFIDRSQLTESEEEIKTILDSAKQRYDEIKGTKYSYSFDNDGNIIENLEIDFKNLDYEKYQALNAANLEGDISKGVSLKASLEFIKKQGYVEVE